VTRDKPLAQNDKIIKKRISRDNSLEVKKSQKIQNEINLLRWKVWSLRKKKKKIWRHV
jgi:hypothetical protein